jgi:hypothetical protein
MEVWLAHHGRAGLTPEDRAILPPRFEKLSRDARFGRVVDREGALSVGRSSIGLRPAPERARLFD